MPDSRRPSIRLLTLSTTLALLASVGTYVWLSDDDQATTDTGVELTPSDESAHPDGAVFTTFEGDEVALASLRGQPVVVNFFSSTCVPCITEMPAFEEVHRALGTEVTFLGLAMADRPEEAKALVKRTGVTYRTAQDKDGSVIAALGGTVLPTTILLDTEGDIVATHSGELTASELRELLAAQFGIGR